MNKALLTASALGLTLLAVMVGYLAWLRYEDYLQANQLPPRRPGGALLICGGGDIADEVYQRFVHIAGGAEGRLIVIPSYSPSPQDTAELIDVWKRRGIGSVDVLHAATRQQCNDPRFAEPLTKATAVWLTGGAQSWLGDTYAGTEVERQLQLLIERGGIIGGTSAGAAAMTRVMIAAGYDAAVEQRGLDLVRNAVIDQHFLRRNRLQRLLGVVDAHPGLLGVGIDEDTAVLIEEDGADWSVLGKSYAVICVPCERKSPRIEILKPGDVTNIDQLKEESGVYAIASPAEIDKWLDNPE